MDDVRQTMGNSRYKTFRLVSLLFYILPIVFLCLSIIITFTSFRSARIEMAEKQLSIVQQAKNNLDYRILQHEEIANGMMLSVFNHLTEDTPINSHYREYVQISNLLVTYADRGMISAVRLYVPDEKQYSKQKDIFYPLSDLFNSPYSSHTSIGFHWLPTHSVRVSFGHNELSIALLYNVSQLDDYASLAGSLLLYIPVERINSIFTSSGEEMFLVDVNGVTLAHSNETLIGQTLLSIEELVHLRSQDSGFSASQENIVAFSHLNKTDWILVGRTPGFNALTLDSSKMLLLGALWIVTILTLAFQVLMLMYNRFIGETINVIGDMAQSLIPDEAREKPIVPRKHRLPNLHSEWKLEKTIQTIAQSIEKYYMSQIDLANYQIQSLQAQIKPHFLYNTLDIIKWMIVEGHYKDGVWMVNNLSKYLRMSINITSGLVTLQQELELSRTYLDIMQKRFKDRFEVVFDIEDDTIECRLPRLLLQPIMENALLHGLLYCEKNNATLQVRVWQENNTLYVDIEDNGNGMSEEKLTAINDPASGQDGYGLQNIRKRLKLFGGAGAEMNIYSKAKVGTCVSLNMPVKIK